MVGGGTFYVLLSGARLFRHAACRPLRYALVVFDRGEVDRETGHSPEKIRACRQSGQKEGGQSG